MLNQSLTEERMRTLRQVLTCDITNLDTRVLQEGVLRTAFHSPPVEPYRTCLSKNDNYWPNCTATLKAACQNYSIVSAKTVRTPFYLIPVLISAVPDLKVIYFTRDPRAVMNSRGKIHHYKDSIFLGHLQNLCLRMKEDFKHYTRAFHRHPSQIMHVVYEELAHNPVKVSREMFHFLGGRDLPNATEAWIRQNTKASISSESRMSTMKNSSATAEKWRQDLPPVLITQMTEVCKETLEIFGYVL